MTIEECMTEGQLKLWLEFRSKVEGTYKKCLLKAKKYNAADVHLPATAWSGEHVVHMSNCRMNDIADYYKHRASLLERFIPRETMYKIQEEVKNDS